MEFDVKTVEYLLARNVSDSAAGYEVDFPQECFDARACCLF